MRRLEITLLTLLLAFGGCKNNKIIASCSAVAPFPPVRVKDREVFELKITGTTQTGSSRYEIPDSCVVISSDIEGGTIGLLEEPCMNIYVRHPTKQTVQEAIQMVRKLDTKYGGGFHIYRLYVEALESGRLHKKTSKNLATILNCLEASY